MEEGNCNGYGTFTWASGQKYTGKWKTDKKDGTGILTDANGNKYVGEWKNDKMDGTGTYTYASGSKYVGEFKNNKKDGTGTLTDTNGNKYVGEWKNDKEDGNGTYTYASGANAGDTYVGEFKNGKKDGNGTYTNDNGSKYVGEWKNDKKDGNGTYTFVVGKKYVGEWKNNKKHGNGTWTNADGTKYVGEWRNDNKDGTGTYTWADGLCRCSKYVGEWKNDKKDGNGTYTAANGDKYVGEWEDGKRHGQGTVTNNGIIYTGSIWVNDVRTDPNRQKMGEDERESFRSNFLSSDPSKKLKAMTTLRKDLSIRTNPPIQQAIDNGLVPILVSFLSENDTPKLQSEAAWALTNITSGSTEQVAVVVQANAVSAFIQLLSSPNDDVREQAIWALCNIAGDSTIHRDALLQAQVIPPLLSQLEPTIKLCILRLSTWTLSNLCRGKPSFELVSPALPTLKHLITQQEDEKVLIDACWALSYLSDGANEQINAVIETEVTNRLVELLLHTSDKIQTLALRTIGNLVSGNENHVQVVIDALALPNLLTLLSISTMQKEACWTCSNITACTSNHIQAVIDANIIPPIIELLSTAEFAIKREAAFAISNATSGGTPEQIEYLVSRGCIPPLCDILTVQDNKIVTVALKGLENILKTGKYTLIIKNGAGLEKIVKLQDHEDDEIKNIALKLYGEYLFEGEVREGETKEGSGSNGSVLSSPSSGLSESDILALVEAAGNKITEEFDNGNVYVCQMKGGKRNGYGTYTWANGNKHVGQYKNDKKDGNGTWTHTNGDKHVGQYKNGKRHGNGTYTWADGGKYVGEFKNDKKDGNGTYTAANGDKYVGPWKNDERHGYGMFTFADGTIETGEWVNGVDPNPNAIYTNISEEEEEIFEGDIRIRIMFGKKGKIWKLLGSGHYSYGEIIDGFRETFVVECHPDTPTEKSLMDFENIDITVSSGLLKGEEDPVEVTDAIGSAVPLPWNSTSKPILYIVVRNST